MGRGDRDVAGHHERSPCTGSHAIDRTDGGHAQALQAPRGGIEGLLDHWAGVGAGDQIWAGLEVEFSKVGASAKAAPGASDDQLADRRIGLGAVQRGS